MLCLVFRLYITDDLLARHNAGKLEERSSNTYIFSEERPMFEFYDLRKDPHEMDDVYGESGYAEAEHELMAQLHRWMIIYRDVVPLPILPPSMR